VLATNAQGATPRTIPYAHPVTNVILLGGEGAANRDRFVTLDPKEGWAPKNRYIKSWTLNGFTLPAGTGQALDHLQCLYCEGYYYTRYEVGHLVKINPATWDAEVIAMTNSGRVYGMAFHPTRTTELWMGYDAGAGAGFQNSICRIADVTSSDTIILEKMSGAVNGAHRDGPLASAQFWKPRQLNFDAEGNLYVGDIGNQVIRKIDTENMMVETIIGIPGKSGFKDGNKDDALFADPHGIVIDPEGVIYVTDWANSRVRRIAIE
jgi:hypothetical protein